MPLFMLLGALAIVPSFCQCEIINLSLHIILAPDLSGHRSLAQTITGQSLGSLNLSVREIPQVPFPLLVQFLTEYREYNKMES